MLLPNLMCLRWQAFGRKKRQLHGAIPAAGEPSSKTEGTRLAKWCYRLRPKWRKVKWASSPETPGRSVPGARLTDVLQSRGRPPGAPSHPRRNRVLTGPYFSPVPRRVILLSRSRLKTVASYGKRTAFILARLTQSPCPSPHAGLTSLSLAWC